MISYIISLLIITLICCVLVIFIVGYFRQSRDHRTELFGLRYRPLLEGTNWSRTNTKRYLIFVPIFFLTKRLVYATALIIAADFLWA